MLFLDSWNGHKQLKAASVVDHYPENVKKVVPQTVEFILDL